MSSRGNKLWSYRRKQLQLANISYRKGEGIMNRVDSEPSYDRSKITEGNSPEIVIASDASLES